VPLLRATRPSSLEQPPCSLQHDEAEQSEQPSVDHRGSSTRAGSGYPDTATAERASGTPSSTRRGCPCGHLTHDSDHDPRPARCGDHDGEIEKNMIGRAQREEVSTCSSRYASP
jgi:hypothetical protein